MPLASTQDGQCKGRATPGSRRQTAPLEHRRHLCLPSTMFALNCVCPQLTSQITTTAPGATSPRGQARLTATSDTFASQEKGTWAGGAGSRGGGRGSGVRQASSARRRAKCGQRAAAPASTATTALPEARVRGGAAPLSGFLPVRLTLTLQLLLLLLLLQQLLLLPLYYYYYYNYYHYYYHYYYREGSAGVRGRQLLHGRGRGAVP
jgi:hypothetical protein